MRRMWDCPPLSGTVKSDSIKRLLNDDVVLACAPMKTFCLEELDDSELVPCVHCQKLFDPTALAEHLRCDHCDCAEDDEMTD